MRSVLPIQFRTAHPRVGGENEDNLVHADDVAGSSPRGRGKRGSTVPITNHPGLIPAWAGKTLRRRSAAALSAAHPRVGGENMPLVYTVLMMKGSSPRGRGKHPDDGADGGGLGLIPAWAGKTQGGRWPPVAGQAHPRVGGENIR